MGPSRLFAQLELGDRAFRELVRKHARQKLGRAPQI